MTTRQFTKYKNRQYGGFYVFSDEEARYRRLHRELIFVLGAHEKCTKDTLAHCTLASLASNAKSRRHSSSRRTLRPSPSVGSAEE